MDLKGQQMSGQYKKLSINITYSSWSIVKNESKISKCNTAMRLDIPPQDRLAVTKIFSAEGYSFSSPQYIFRNSK